MESLTLDEVLNAVSGNLLVKGTDEVYSDVTTDSRKVTKDSIFFALKGTKFDGNEFAEDVSNKGAGACIVDEIKFDKNSLNKNTSIIKVKDAKCALQNLAKYYRSRLNVKVIGVTGSTGKTSTKDVIAALLSSKYKVFKTIGNFNNDLGLPLMIFKIDNSFDIAVLEMGMSHFNEIHFLCSIAKPDMAVITNIGISHIEYLKTRENILKAKLEITDFFDKSNVLSINGDNDLLKNYSSSKFKVIKIGTNKNFDYSADNIKIGESSVSFDIYEKGKVAFKNFKVNVIGKHNVTNILLAVSCARQLGLSYDDMALGADNLSKTSMRLEITKKNGITFINDSYNASPDSMKAAIDVMHNAEGKRRIAVLGTMRELGDFSFKAHFDVGKYAKDNGIDLLISIGEFSGAYKKGFGEDGFMEFKDNDSVSDFLKKNLKENDIILFKASRLLKFENIVNYLKENL